MTAEKRYLIYNIFALVCAIWFLLTGWMWFYYMNLIMTFPFAIVGFFLWRQGRGAEKKLLNKIVGWMLLAGLTISIGYLVVVAVMNW
jgi:phosphoglycerol transferase MdoB-like AlkP superfamily enzyme